MRKDIEVVAFDLGGVLAYQDLDKLTAEELFLLREYMNRKNIKDEELLFYAKSKIPEIYLKIYRLTPEAMETLQMLKDRNIRPSIWTNNIKEINDWFEEVGIYRYVDMKDVINSFYIGINKPNIEFYRRALNTIKSEPQRVLFIDDNYQNIINALRCGINGQVYDMSTSLLKTVERKVKVKRI